MQSLFDVKAKVCSTEEQYLVIAESWADAATKVYDYIKNHRVATKSASHEIMNIELVACEETFNSDCCKLLT